MNRKQPSRARRILIEYEDATESWERGKGAGDQLWFDPIHPSRRPIRPDDLVDRLRDAIEP